MKKCIVFLASLCFMNLSIAALPTPGDDNIANAFSDEFYTAAAGTQGSTFNEDEAVYLNKADKIVPKKMHEEDPVLRYTIDVTYPQISGKNLPEGSLAFNQRVMEIVNQDTDNFKKRVKRDIIHMQTLPEDIQKNYLKLDYDIDVIPLLSLISVRLSIESMQAGRAHPYREHRVLNFDIQNSKEMALSELFKPNSDYLKVIAAYTNKKLQDTVSEKDRWMIAEGTKPNEKNFKNWNIEPDAILITFDEYQVAPHVYGPQEVEIPFEEIKQLLSKQAEIIASSKIPNQELG